MQIKEVMTSHVEIVPPNATLQEAAQKMRQLEIGPLPICDGNRLVGMLTDRDITVRAVAEGCNPTQTLVSQVMTPEVVYCFEDQDLQTAAQMMEMRQIRRIPVLNREKQLVGIVALGDLAVDAGDTKHAGKTLKEVSEPAAPRR